MRDLDSMIRRFCVDEASTVEDALAVIEENNHRCVVVLGPDRRVVGTLSDGDVRKLLLAHTVMSTRVGMVMNLNFRHAVDEPGADATAAAREILRRHAFLSIVPVVDRAMRLVDLRLREELDPAGGNP